MKRRARAVLCLLLLAFAACGGARTRAPRTPPFDPIADVSVERLHAQGLAYARRGDLLRAQQYLSAAQHKGGSPRVLVPELVRICVASSRLRAALELAEPFLSAYPDDLAMRQVVAAIYLALGQEDRAAASLRVARDGGLARAGLELALLAHRQGRPAEARAELSRYLDSQPGEADATRARRLLQRWQDEERAP